MAKKVKVIIENEDETKDNVTYKKHVVMSIVSLATQEINGIASISRKSVSMIRSALSKNINRGIIVDFNNNNAKIDVFVNVKFGFSVKDVAFRVQENIKASVESMTEYKVESVNVHVVGVNFSEVESDFVS
ncbi:MAG: Asp23/Gls24 family envelope stress response protein [Clostridia bacterium]|nr:Asp23/Gls24 family envelope stress response protein [Clostridiales bacterium]MBQ7918050.1 Asp23/Gls24 family envelope stress response protein [Clostridia bacterium]